MDKYQENIAPASGQNTANVFIYGNEKSKIKILFAGNSITKHMPRPEIGWHKDCGMAASSPEHDYVHLVVDKIREKYDPNVSFCIAQVAEYEVSFFENTPDVEYEAAKNYGADIVFMFYGANVNGAYDGMENPPKTFEKAYGDMRNYLASPKACVYHSMGFYKRPKLEVEKKAVAEKYGDTFIDISHIRDLDESHGDFNHPSDLGMQMLADTFFDAMEEDIKKICESK